MLLLKESYDLLINADIDEVFAVNNKEIVPPENYSDIVVKGDNRSNSLIFKMNSILDGVDISDKKFEIFYINADGYSDVATANAVNASENFILFSWLIDGNVTHSAGDVSFIIRVTGADYVWKSKPYTIKIADTLDDDINPSEYSSTWTKAIESRLAALEESNLSNDALTSRVEALENTNANIEDRLAILEENISDEKSLLEKIANIENSISSINERISVLEKGEIYENVYYDFECNNEGAYNESYQGSTGTWKGLTINAESGKLAPNAGANCTQINAGTEIIIPVKSNCVVTVQACRGFAEGKLKLSQNETEVTAADDSISLNAVKGNVVLTAIEGSYIASISVTYGEA